MAVEAQLRLRAEWPSAETAAARAWRPCAVAPGPIRV